jgi:hypothetical protein
MKLNLKSQVSDLEDIIAGLTSQLQKLAPPPAKPFIIGQKQAISSGFNQHAANDDLMGAYTRDLPCRLGLERRLDHYQRKLYALRKQTIQHPAPALYA